MQQNIHGAVIGNPASTVRCTQTRMQSTPTGLRTAFCHSRLESVHVETVEHLDVTIWCRVNSMGCTLRKSWHDYIRRGRIASRTCPQFRHQHQHLRPYARAARCREQSYLCIMPCAGGNDMGTNTRNLMPSGEARETCRRQDSKKTEVGTVVVDPCERESRGRRWKMADGRWQMED